SAPSTLQTTCPIMLHGLPNQYNRWFDKSFQLIVCQNGTAGINMEHSGIDGHTILRLATDIYQDSLSKPPIRVVKDSFEGGIIPVNRLEWRVSPGLKQVCFCEMGY